MNGFELGIPGKILFLRQNMVLYEMMEISLARYVYGILSGSGYIFKYLHKNQKIKHFVLNIIFYDFSLSKFCPSPFLSHLVHPGGPVRCSLTMPCKLFDLGTKGHYIKMIYY